MVSMSVDCLEHLLSCCVALKKLSLENCQFSDKACLILADQNSQTLTTLHMAMVNVYLANDRLENHGWRHEKSPKLKQNTASSGPVSSPQA